MKIWLFQCIDGRGGGELERGSFIKDRKLQIKSNHVVTIWLQTYILG